MQQVGLPPRPGAAGAKSAPGLVLLYADDYESLPAAWPLNKERVSIGRDAAADICLQIPAVSRMHAELAWDESHWTVRDLGSRNGTLLDGHPVEQAQLERGSELRIGDGVFKFLDQNAVEYCDYRIDGHVEGRGRLVKGSELVGGYHMDRIAAELSRVAPTNLSVVLLGESGTGKEVVARELHRASGRKGAFQAVNCAAIPAALLESELFGYKRGAFSGAERDKPGLIRMADQGTLLLDEIGDMPLEAQAKLLRVLQSREVFPLGATSAERVDLRVVCATHRDLQRLIQAEKFREDLYARLNEYQLRLPPLRDRKEDIYQLSLAFLGRHGRSDLKFTFGFVLGLVSYDWPYNVRELEACIKRCIALSDGSSIDENLLPEPIKDLMSEYGQPLQAERQSSVQFAESNRIGRGGAPTNAQLHELLEKHHGNVAAIGRELGKARMQVHRWMDRYGIDVDDFR
jgi:transcriptional regulator with PAS, ATPase and Fis domain